MTQRIVLQKIPKEDREKNEKLPYFRLVLPPENEGDDWEDIGALWPAKSGNGYSGMLQEGVAITVDRPKKDKTEGTSNQEGD